MREIRVLTGRTIKLYLKNPLSILFSFVYMLLFMVLISVFLGDYMATAMKELYVGVTGIDLSQIRWLVDTTSMAGVLMINCILVPLNVFTIMVQDSGDHRLDSFLVSAASRGKLVFGYWLAPFCVGVVMNSIGLFVAEGFIVVNGGTWLSVESNLQMIGLITANTFSSTSIFFVVAMLINKINLYSTFTGIMSAFVGFITGAFLPIGVFPERIQKLFVLFPAHHGATMMRDIMTREPLAATFSNVSDQTIKGVVMSAQEIIETYCTENGITYLFGNTKVSFPLMLSVVIGSGVLFLAVSFFLMKRYVKE